MNPTIQALLGLGILFSIVGFQYWRRERLKQRLKGLWDQAQAALKDDRMADAEQALRESLRLVPLLVVARRALGAVLAKQGRLEEAAKELALAAELQPKKPEGHLDLAIFYTQFQPERADEALAALVKAAAHAPALRADIARDPRFAALRALPDFARHFPA
jgi:predicted Zn-dependent protease